MAQKLSIGTRVRVKNTMLYNDRIGVLQANSGDPEDMWDFNVLLEPTEVPEGTSRHFEKIYGERVIGVNDFQVEPI